MRTGDGPLKAYRIASRKYAALDGVGAALYPQRWNRLGEPLIYAAESLAVCQLEILVHIDRATPPRNHAWIEITIPEEVSWVAVDAAEIPRWNRSDMAASRRFGSAWIRSLRSAVLIVPSKAASNGRNVLINPLHSDFSKISHVVHRSMKWDPRLFDRKT